MNLLEYIWDLLGSASVYQQEQPNLTSAPPPTSASDCESGTDQVYRHKPLSTSEQYLHPLLKSRSPYITGPAVPQSDAVPPSDAIPRSETAPEPTLHSVHVSDVKLALEKDKDKQLHSGEAHEREVAASPTTSDVDEAMERDFDECPSVMSIDLRDNPLQDEGVAESEETQERSPVYNRRYVSLREPCTDEEIREPLPRCFYFFIATQNFLCARAIARDLGAKQISPRTCLLAKTFLRFMLNHSAGGRGMSKMLTQRHYKPFSYFRSHAMSSLFNQEMPPVAHLEEISEWKSAVARRTPHNTLNLPSDRTLCAMTEGVRNGSRASQRTTSQASAASKKRRREKDEVSLGRQQLRYGGRHGGNVEKKNASKRWISLI